MVHISISAQCDPCAIKYIQHGNKYYPGQVVSYKNKKYILDSFDGNVARACPLWEVLVIYSSNRLYWEDLEEYSYVNKGFKLMYKVKPKSVCCTEYKYCSKCDDSYNKHTGFECCPYCGNELVVINEGYVSIDNDVIKD